MLSRDYNTLKQFWNLNGLGQVALFSARDLDSFLSKNSINEILSPRELFVLENKPSKKRRDEWLLGRFASKYLLQSQLNTKSLVPLNEIESYTDSYKKPVFKIKNNNLNLDISISHTNDFAVAALSINKNIKVGVDVERTRKIREATYKYFLTTLELKQLKLSKNKDSTATKFWVFKEAVLKSLGIGLQGSLKGVEINLNGKISIDISKDNLKIANFKKIKHIHSFYQPIDGFHLATVLLEK
jgi:phosphopantetheinyl transferase